MFERPRRRHWLRPLTIALAAAAIAACWEGTAFAYIDPSTSGTLMQIIAPVLIALGVLRQRIMLALRLAVARVRRMLGRDDRE